MASMDEDSSDLKMNLISMGFNSDDVVNAIKRANGDADFAVELLSSGRIHQDEDEFDILAAHESATPLTTTNASSNIEPPSQRYSDNVDPIQATTGGSVEEAVDVRIAKLTEMGFSSQQAINAMKACNGDLNAALNMLTTAMGDDDA